MFLALTHSIKFYPLLGIFNNWLWMDYTAKFQCLDISVYILNYPSFLQCFKLISLPSVSPFPLHNNLLLYLKNMTFLFFFFLWPTTSFLKAPLYSWTCEAFSLLLLICGLFSPTQIMSIYKKGSFVCLLNLTLKTYFFRLFLLKMN